MRFERRQVAQMPDDGRIVILIAALEPITNRGQGPCLTLS
jgi:hypothetical protein